MKKKKQTGKMSQKRSKHYTKKRRIIYSILRKKKYCIHEIRQSAMKKEVY